MGLEFFSAGLEFFLKTHKKRACLNDEIKIDFAFLKWVTGPLHEGPSAL